jgi:putative ABC transport system ATP-binding protein
LGRVTHAPLDGRTAALELRGVRKTFEADTAPVRALRGVDLRVGAGEFVALMGPSGCGKSTLLHLAAGLDRPDDGSVRLAGSEVADLSESRLAKVRRQHVGLIFQFFHLLEGMTVLENVVLAALVAGRSRRHAEARGRDLLDLLGLLDKSSASPATLSGGQRQRLAIARALANEPTLLLADEPTGALDSDGAAEVLDLFRRLHERGQSILMVTHNPDVAVGAQRVVHMRDGHVHEAQPATDAEAVPTP